MFRPQRVLFCLLIALAVAAGCTGRPPLERTKLTPKSLSDLQEVLKKEPTELDTFRARGPFDIITEENREIRLQGERFFANLYLSQPAEKAPLVILVHGHDSSKEAHANQAALIASWGLHALTVQLPKKGPWVTNGQRLKRIVEFIRRAPEVIAHRIDSNRIILVGHSFGAVAVSVALADGAPALGGILLDPAAYDKRVPAYLKRISKPVLVLGADEEVATTRNRDFFFDYIRGVREVSIKGAAHEDAQYPSETSLQYFGLDPDTTEEHQITFVSAMVSAALSLAATGSFDNAWKSYEPELKQGKLIQARTK